MGGSVKFPNAATDRWGVGTTSHIATTATPARTAWLRVADVAQLLGLSVNTVRRWTDAGRIPAHRSPGGHRRYLLDEIVTLAPDVELPPVVDRPPPAVLPSVAVAPAPAPPSASGGAPRTPPDRGGNGLAPRTLGELATVLAESPHEFPARAASVLREATGAGRCEVLSLTGGRVEVLVSVDAAGEDATRLGQRRGLADWRPPMEGPEMAPVALRRDTPSPESATVTCERAIFATRCVGIWDESAKGSSYMSDNCGMTASASAALTLSSVCRVPRCAATLAA